MKNKLKAKPVMYTALLTFLLFCSVTYTNAQAANSWKIESEVNGVKLYSKIDTCGSTNSLFLKLENTTTSIKRVFYNIIIESPGNNLPVLPRSFEIKAFETKVADCNNNKELATDIFGITNVKLIVRMTVN
jgi:hypothetical protein